MTNRRVAALLQLELAKADAIPFLQSIPRADKTPTGWCLVRTGVIQLCVGDAGFGMVGPGEMVLCGPFEGVAVSSSGPVEVEWWPLMPGHPAVTTAADQVAIARYQTIVQHLARLNPIHDAGARLAQWLAGYAEQFGRNMKRAKVPDTVSMRISGHKTREIFDRYDIVDESDLESAAKSVASYFSERKQQRAAKLKRVK